MRTGFLHLAEALAYHRDTEVPLRTIIAMLKAGDRCNAEAELIGKGIDGVIAWMCMCMISFEIMASDLVFQTLVKYLLIDRVNLH